MINIGTADSSTIVEAMKNFPDGINFVTVGEKVSYLLKLDETFVLSNCIINMSRKNENNLHSRCNKLYKNYRNFFIYKHSSTFILQLMNYWSLDNLGFQR